MSAGVYGERLVISRSVDILGDGSNVTTIDGGRSGRVVTVDTSAGTTISVRLEALSVRNGFVSEDDNARGGGIFVGRDASLQLKGCVVSDNVVETNNRGPTSATARGGGIYSDGDLFIYQTTIRDNVARGRLPGGGGVAAFGAQLEVDRSSVLRNRAEPQPDGYATGGGLHIAARSAQIVRSTIGVNSVGLGATLGRGGGAIVAFGSQAVRFDRATIVSNQAWGGDGVAGGGGLYSQAQRRDGAPVIRLKGTALAGNQDGNAIGPNCAGETMLSNGYNVVSYMAGCRISPDPLNVPPRPDILPPVDTAIQVSYGPPQDNGGPTLTMMPSDDSPLLDVPGFSSCAPTDQRGHLAPEGESCDAGAVEAPGVPLPATAPAQLDVHRITQGLDRDLTAGVYYKLIAGKDALVRLQVFAPSRQRLIGAASCTVQRLTRIDGTWLTPLQRRPDQGPIVMIPGSYDPFGAPIPRRQYGYFHTTNLIDCWVDAANVTIAGDYAIRAEVSMIGEPQPSQLDLGVYTFYSTANLRVLLLPYVVPPGHREFVPWTAVEKTDLMNALQEVNRRFPYRTGVGPIDTPWVAGSGGLRVNIGPVRACPRPAGTPTTTEIDKAKEECDNEVRAAALAARNQLNATYDELDPSRSHDRIDVSGVVNAVPITGGGSAGPPGADCVAGSAISPDPNASGSVVGHEIGHCLGLVPNVSPHWTPLEETHSSTATIGVPLNAQHVDLKRRQDQPAATSIMNATVPGNTFLEGWEWNWLGPLTRISDPNAPTTPAQGTRRRANFEISGTLLRTGTVRHLYAAPLDRPMLETTRVARRSPLLLIFRDSRGRVLDRIPIAVDPTPGHLRPDSFPFYVATIKPPAATQVSLNFKGNQVAHFAKRSRGPGVGRVRLDETDTTMVLSWSNSAPANGVTYRVLFRRTPSEVPMIIASGLTSSIFAVWKNSVPATSDATFIVEASDGFSSATSTSEPISAAPSAPLISIAAPRQSGVHLATRDVVLSGTAWDSDFRPLATATWHSDQQGFLGAGSMVRARLAPGLHEIRFAGTDSRNRAAEAKVSILVEFDVDNDGIPDMAEIRHPCLTVGEADGEVDYDGDGLSSALEISLQTNPCVADTDGDGVTDGVELHHASEPRNVKSVPQAARLNISDRLVNIGSCNANRRHVRRVYVSNAMPWKASADSDWIVLDRDQEDASQLVVRARCTDLPRGTYRGRVLVSGPSSQPVELDVRMTVP